MIKVTLGIHPTKPETGFGYIQYDADKVTETEIETKERNEVKSMMSVPPGDGEKD